MNWTLLRATPYVWGGREIGVGLDCLGVVLCILRDHFGYVVPDPWLSMTSEAAAGRGPGAGLPTSWFRVAECGDLRSGDVVLYFGSHPGCGVVVDGRTWSTTPHVGRPFSVPVDRDARRVVEVWRNGSDSLQARPSR